MWDEDDRQRWWDARIAAATAVFGQQSDMVLHAAVPFFMGQDIGGKPDVVMFPNFLEGTLYMTAALIGDEDQPPNSHGKYELAIAHAPGEDWGVNIICQLAYYTLDTVIDDGQTMDIRSATPSSSEITAFLFRRIASFQVLDAPSNVICCVGITTPELKLARKSGSKTLIEALGEDFLLTDLYRASVV